MTRTLTAIAAAGAIAMATLAAPTTADARWRGGGVAAGIVGAAAGLAIGSAIANRGYNGYGYYDEPGYAYEPGYGYEAGPPVAYGYRYRPATSDITNSDRMGAGSR